MSNIIVGPRYKSGLLFYINCNAQIFPAYFNNPMTTVENVYCLRV